MTRPQDFLNQLQIASPCDVPWDAMTGDHRARHCAQCDKKVYNLANLTTEEAMALFSNPDEMPCIQLWRRADGTVLTADCPVGQRRLRGRHMRPVAAAVFTALLACGAAYAQAPRTTRGEPAPHKTGGKPTRPTKPPQKVGKIAPPPQMVQGEMVCPPQPQEKK
jgi:hypothetical protein